MLLSEAKEILKNNGYNLVEGSSTYTDNISFRSTEDRDYAAGILKRLGLNYKYPKFDNPDVYGLWFDTTGIKGKKYNDLINIILNELDDAGIAYHDVSELDDYDLSIGK